MAEQANIRHALRFRPDMTVTEWAYHFGISVETVRQVAYRYERDMGLTREQPDPNYKGETA